MSSAKGSSEVREPAAGGEPSSELAPEGAGCRAVILQRRARFVAAALASAGLATGAGCDLAQTCLTPPAPPTATAAATDTEQPMVCLEVPEPPENDDAGAQADLGSSGSDAGRDPASPPAAPKPCLEVAPTAPTKPRPCLSMRPPSKKPSVR